MERLERLEAKRDKFLERAAKLDARIVKMGGKSRMTIEDDDAKTE